MNGLKKKKTWNRKNQFHLPLNDQAKKKKKKN